MSQIGTEDSNSSHSESESSLLGDDEENKIKLDNPSPEPLKREPTPEAEIDLDPEPEPKKKKRKRKAAEEENNANNRKICKSNQDPVPTNNDTDRGESSGTTIETKVQDNGCVKQALVKMLSLEICLLTETGRYEVTTATFDFDLCLLDRSTVQQLIQLVGC
ncbi:hypothetical protein ACJJTC_014031 [Scirpophaga incertulas]